MLVEFNLSANTAWQISSWFPGREKKRSEETTAGVNAAPTCKLGPPPAPNQMWPGKEVLKHLQNAVQWGLVWRHCLVASSVSHFPGTEFRILLLFLGVLSIGQAWEWLVLTTRFHLAFCITSHQWIRLRRAQILSWTFLLNSSWY